jgi:hypothetical protein
MHKGAAAEGHRVRPRRRKGAIAPQCILQHLHRISPRTLPPCTLVSSRCALRITTMSRCAADAPIAICARVSAPVDTDDRRTRVRCLGTWIPAASIGLVDKLICPADSGSAWRWPGSSIRMPL